MAVGVAWSDMWAINAPWRVVVSWGRQGVGLVRWRRGKVKCGSGVAGIKWEGGGKFDFGFDPFLLITG